MGEELLVGPEQLRAGAVEDRAEVVIGIAIVDDNRQPQLRGEVPHLCVHAFLGADKVGGLPIEQSFHGRAPVGIATGFIGGAADRGAVKHPSAAPIAVGAARAVFTGRGVIRSGLDMFVVGLGVAAAVRTAHLLIQKTESACPGTGSHDEELVRLEAALDRLERALVRAGHLDAVVLHPTAGPVLRGP